MRRHEPPTNTGRPEPPDMSPGEMRQDFADYARDSKKEGGMCAFGLCTNPAANYAVPGWHGRYGGHEVCKKHAEKLGYDPEADEWDRTHDSAGTGDGPSLITDGETDDEDGGER